MRKLTAILLIGIFALSQYARQLSYIKCRLSNNFKPASLQCDCEKQAGFDKQGTDPSSAPKTHLHLHLDEFFSTPHNEILIRGFYTPGSFPHIYMDNESEGTYPPPWQPPNS